MPVLLLDAQAVRTGWAEILALTEALAPEPSLLPSDPEARRRTLELCHELMSEDGLLWCARLLAIDAAFASDGREGFSLKAAQYLAPRYGWTESCAPRAKARAEQVLGSLAAELARTGGPFYAGAALTALDLYSASALNCLVPLPEADCPLAPPLRATFSWMGRALGSALTPALLAHRERVVSAHFDLPIEL